MNISKRSSALNVIAREKAGLSSNGFWGSVSGEGLDLASLSNSLCAAIDGHIPFLVAAIRIGEPRLFALYVSWALEKRDHHGSETSLKDELNILAKLMAGYLPPKEQDLMRLCIDSGIKVLIAGPGETQNASGPLFGTMLRYTAALLEAQRDEAAKIIFDTQASGVPLKDIYTDIIQESQYEIGRLWFENKISIAQEHYCTAITQMIMAQLYPQLKSSRRNGKTVITTCVSEEQHEVGIRMVADLLELEGYDTYHVGANCPRADLIHLVETRKADLVAISATMAYHLPLVKQIISDIRNSKMSHGVKIMVGGYPFNQVPTLWQRAGADGFAPNAARAVEEAKILTGVR